MCKCTPNLRTPFCGKPGCDSPNPIHVVEIDYRQLQHNLYLLFDVVDKVAKTATNELKQHMAYSDYLMECIETKLKITLMEIFEDDDLCNLLHNHDLGK